MAEKLTKAGDHDGRYEYSHGWLGFYMGRDAEGKQVWKKLPYLPKVIEGGICIEEPWYIPSWKTLADLLTFEWKKNESECWLCNGSSFLKTCKVCHAKYCNSLCAERDNNLCKHILVDDYRTLISFS